MLHPMGIHAVYQPPSASVADADAPLVLIRQGFRITAALFPPLWLAWRRMWWTAAAAVAFYLALGFAPLSPSGMGVMAVASALFFGLEGNSLYESSLQRRGWRLGAVIVAASALEAETLFRRRQIGAWPQ